MAARDLAGMALALAVACSSNQGAETVTAGREAGARSAAESLDSARAELAARRKTEPETCSGEDPRVGSAFLESALHTTGSSAVGSVGIGGRPALIAFWAGWCGPCRDELPLYLERRSQLADWGVDLVLVSVDEDPKDVATALSDFGLSNVESFYGGGGLLKQFFQSKMPWTILVDGGRTIRASHTGFDQACLPSLLAHARVLGLEARASRD